MIEINTEKLKEIVNFTFEGTFDEYKLYEKTADIPSLQSEVEPAIVIEGIRKGEKFRLAYSYKDLHSMHEDGSLNHKLLKDRDFIFKSTN